MIRANNPDPLEFHRTAPFGDACGFIILRFTQFDVEKQCIQLDVSIDKVRRGK